MAELQILKHTDGYTDPLTGKFKPEAFDRIAKVVGKAHWSCRNKYDNIFGNHNS